MRTQIAEGLRYLSRHRLLRMVAVLLGVTNFASQMGRSTLVLLAVQILHTGTRGYGLLWTAAAAGPRRAAEAAPLDAVRGRMLAARECCKRPEVSGRICRLKCRDVAAAQLACLDE
jgi:hypothetical protein